MAAGGAGLAVTRPLVSPQCPSETYDPLLRSTKDFPDEVISFVRSHQLMWEPVQPEGRQPVLVRVNVPYRLRRLLVHRLETESRHYDVLFLGTGRASAQLWGRVHHTVAGWQECPPSPGEPGPASSFSRCVWQMRVRF